MQRALEEVREAEVELRRGVHAEQRGVLHRLAFASFLSQLSMLLHGTGVRGGLRVNAFRQLHLNIKSNLPPPFCSGAFAERDELCQCAPGGVKDW